MSEKLTPTDADYTETCNALKHEIEIHFIPVKNDVHVLTYNSAENVVSISSHATNKAVSIQHRTIQSFTQLCDKFLC
jgi:hypothetical protein